MKFKLKRIAKGLLFCWLMTLYSCENDSSVTNDLISKDKTIVNTREYFKNNKPNLEALEYTKTVDWDNAILLNNDGEQAIEVPLILFDNTSTNVVEDQDYKTYMRLLFIKNITVHIIRLILSILPKINHSIIMINLLIYLILVLNIQDI